MEQEEANVRYRHGCEYEEAVPENIMRNNAPVKRTSDFCFEGYGELLYLRRGKCLDAAMALVPCNRLAQTVFKSRCCREVKVIAGSANV